ncbi:carbohydrate binding family 9 domain-containing protein [Aquimarina sp. MMG015]|uniref:DUF5916 domain-containing protein n=1 Tax=Aquimarina TaxID=290174 RepID=UPI000422B58C|nr:MULTISPECIES: DUF5916 domain-containing protein [Aquimarina]AXT57795.1 hydrolase [Aquimarina sp. AD1]MBQ4803267.1 carbohydrate binding family 9 domain-containing protein [Aquimarina sp. MMG015]RKN26240.1 hydrolase [Aquimarina sp. AD1]
MKYAIHVLGFLLFTLFSNAQDSTVVKKRVYTTKPLNGSEAPTINGLIEESSWDLVEWSGDFIENEPDENTPPSQQTKFKILYDQKYLYIAYRCYDTEPDKIEKRLSRRDGFAGDWVEINLDSYHDKRTGFSFTITAAGVKGDEFISDNGNNWDGSWNPIWYTATNIDDQGWTAEVKIPLSQLKFGKSKEQIWGLQVNRRFFRKEERSVWQRVPQDAPGWVSEFGELHGLIDIEPQKQLEIQPFVVTQYDTFPEEDGNPFRDGDDFKLNGGLDAKIGITNDLTMDLTVNPDFGQVEADPAAIALDGFQIFFREQRPFFVENKNIFDYRFANGQDNVFYSRRIGRSPQGSIGSSPINTEFVDRPTNTTILGAAKFSGKTKNGWSIGVLESVTQREIAKVEDADGNRRETIVEPLTNYFVGRVQKDFNDRNTYIGGIFTATNRNLGDILNIDYEDPNTDETSELVGLRENNLNFLRKSAYTAGLDFRHNWKDRKYFVEGNLVTSHVEGSKEAIEATQNELTHLFQRVDADHVKVDPNRTSLTGTGGKLIGGKSGGGNWRYTGGVFWRSPELELNDVGFLRQADDIRQFANVRYLFLKPTKFYRRANLNFEQTSAFDFEGNFNRIQYEFNGFINYKNNWWTEVGAAHKPRIYTNTVLRGGPRWRFSEENFAFLFFGSDSRKKFNFTMGYVNSGARQNNFTFHRYVLRMRYQPFNALSISLNPEFERNPNKTQYVTEVDFAGTPRYITARIDQQTLSASVRLNYNINPNLTIQYYGQPFISRGTYTDFNYVNNPIASDLNERVTLYNDNQISFADDLYSVDENLDGVIDYTIDNPDFAFVQFRSNLVLRWEYIPGSEIFLVWSQGVNGLGDPGDHLFRSLDNQIFGQQPENTFLIKATYRFVL